MDNGDGHRPTEGPPKPCGAQIFQPFGNSRDFCASLLPTLQPRGASIHSPKQGYTSSRCTLKIPWWARSLWLIMYFLSLLPRIVVRIAEIRAMCRIIMFVLCTTQTFDHNINSYRKRMYYSTDTSVLSFYKTCGKKEHSVHLFGSALQWAQTVVNKYKSKQNVNHVTRNDKRQGTFHELLN
jgi:hypothetical protein